jgi:hypothetical protein
MRTIARLFGKSPFAPLKVHMKKVALCVEQLKSLFHTFQTGRHEDLWDLAKSISKLEYEADLTKNDMRNHMPGNLFLPVERYDLLQILHIQDSIADTCEHISMTLTLHPLSIPNQLKKDFSEFVLKSLETFEKTHTVILEFDNLIESTFGGIEAEKVKMLTEEVSYVDHQSSKLKHALSKTLFEIADSMPHHVFYLWTRLLDDIARFSKLSERLCGRVRMILDVS